MPGRSPLPVWTVVRTCVAGAGLLGLVAGCGTSSTLVDTTTARPVINKEIQLSGAPPARAVSCPDTDAKAGKTFTCHVTLQDGSVYDMTIRIEKVMGRQVLLKVAASQLRTIGPSNVKPLIDKQLRSTHAPAATSISCQHVAAKVGTTFTCAVSLADGHVLTDGFRVLTVNPSAAPSFDIKGLSIK